MECTVYSAVRAAVCRMVRVTMSDVTAVIRYGLLAGLSAPVVGVAMRQQEAWRGVE